MDTSTTVSKRAMRDRNTLFLNMWPPLPETRHTIGALSTQSRPWTVAPIKESPNESNSIPEYGTVKGTSRQGESKHGGRKLVD